jgi:hypothetical protein
MFRSRICAYDFSVSILVHDPLRHGRKQEMVIVNLLLEIGYFCGFVYFSCHFLSKYFSSINARSFRLNNGLRMLAVNPYSSGRAITGSSVLPPKRIEVESRFKADRSAIKQALFVQWRQTPAGE